HSLSFWSRLFYLQACDRQVAAFRSLRRNRRLAPSSTPVRVARDSPKLLLRFVACEHSGFRASLDSSAVRVFMTVAGPVIRLVIPRRRRFLLSSVARRSVS